MTVREGGADFAGRPLTVPVGGAAPGATATLCVRPHLIGLGESPAPGGNTLHGTVAEIQWRGATHRLYVAAGGHRIMVDVRELREPPALGTEIALHFAPEDAVLIPAGLAADGAPHA